MPRRQRGPHRLRAGCSRRQASRRRPKDQGRRQHQPHACALPCTSPRLLRAVEVAAAATVAGVGRPGSGGSAGAFWWDVSSLSSLARQTAGPCCCTKLVVIEISGGARRRLLSPFTKLVSTRAAVLNDSVGGYIDVRSACGGGDRGAHCCRACREGGSLFRTSTASTDLLNKLQVGAEVVLDLRGRSVAGRVQLISTGHICYCLAQPYTVVR